MGHGAKKFRGQGMNLLIFRGASFVCQNQFRYFQREISLNFSWGMQHRCFFFFFVFLLVLWLEASHSSPILLHLEKKRDCRQSEQKERERETMLFFRFYFFLTRRSVSLSLFCLSFFFSSLLPSLCGSSIALRIL